MQPSAALHLLFKAVSWGVSESRSRRRKEFWCLLCCWPSGSFSTGRVKGGGREGGTKKENKEEKADAKSKRDGVREN